ncbi:MAG: ABC transporter substrate-binding protein [Thermodesulfobacteriota bacterium]
MRSTRGLSLVLGLAMLVGCGMGPEEKPVPVVGIVNANPAMGKAVAGFREEFGREQPGAGRGVRFVDPGQLAGPEQVDAALREMVAGKVDLVFVTSTPTALQAKEVLAGRDVPVVFAPVFNVLASGLMENPMRPGGFMTGIQGGGHAGKALEWHLRAVPHARRLLVPLLPADPSAQQCLAELQDAAFPLGVELLVREIQDETQLRSVSDGLPGDIDALWLLNSPKLIRLVKLFTEVAIAQGWVLSSATSQVEGGVMVSFGQDLTETGRRAGRLARRILEGVPPAQIPVEPAEYRLGINLGTARAAGVTIADEVLRQADIIVQ